MAGELVRVAAQRMTRPAPRLDPRRKGSTTNSAPAFPTTRRRTRRTRSRRRSTTSPPAGRWTGSSAATSASARRRWRCAPPSPRRSTASRPRSSCRRRCSPASTRRVFRERFSGLPVRIGQLSRMVGAAEQRETKKGLAEGGVDIVIGTHAVLGKTVELQGPRPRRRRRGAAFRRRPQGAAEGAARRSAHADALGDADSRAPCSSP